MSMITNIKMKRINNLFEKICDLNNLRIADLKARKGKLRSYGVRHHDLNRDHNIHELHKELVEGTFKTSQYSVFDIVSDAGKRRTIYRLPYYPDRILHHAILNILEPIWVSIFTSDTYSCIKNRGIHAIVRKLKRDIKDDNNTKYCLKLDITKFYPSINHEILKQIIRKKIKDKRLLSLLDEIIDSAPGVPIGNYLSQFFANIYLTYFDHYIKEVKKVKYYYRYADDIVILHGEKVYLRDILNDIKTYFDEKLKLQVKSNYQVFPVHARGIDFVGYIFYHTHVLLRKRIKQNFAKYVKKHKCTIKQCPQYGWAIHCNSVNLIKTLSNERAIRSSTT